MTTINTTEIPLDKADMGKNCIRLMALTAGFALLLAFSDTFQFKGFGKVGVFTLGIICITAGVIFGIRLLIKLFDKTPGLIIKEEGIMGNSIINFGLIKWEEIQSLAVIPAPGQLIMLIFLHHPQEFINKQSSWYKRKLMQLEWSFRGTPATLYSKGLKCNFIDLDMKIKKIFEEKHQQTQ